MNRVLLPLVSVTILIVGCVKPPIEGRLDPYTPAQLHFASKELKNDTAVGTPTASRDAAGQILYVTVPVRSATNKDLHVDYRVTFFDRTGTPINSTSWFTRTLVSNVPDYITVKSTTPLAADFQVDFRYAQ